MSKIGLWVSCVVASMLMIGCLSEEPAHIEFGKDFNGYQNKVMDTTSAFKLNDPFMLQLYNGKEFGVDSVDMVLKEGSVSGATLLERKVRVKSNSRDLVIRGTQNDPLTARGFLRTSKVGDYTLIFSLNGQMIAQKQLSLHNSKE